MSEDDGQASADNDGTSDISDNDSIASHADSYEAELIEEHQEHIFETGLKHFQNWELARIPELLNMLLRLPANTEPWRDTFPINPPHSGGCKCRPWQNSGLAHADSAYYGSRLAG